VKFLLNTNMNENVQKVAKAFFCYLDASAPESPVLSYRYFVNRNYNDVTGERCFWPPVKIGSDLLSTWESLANGDFKKPCVDPCFDLKAAGGHFAGWDLEKCQVVTVCSPEDHVQLNGLSAVKCMHYHGSSDLMDKFRSVKQPPKIMCSKESLRTAKHLRLRYVTVEVSTEEKKAPSPKEVGGLDSNGDIFEFDHTSWQVMKLLKDEYWTQGVVDVSMMSDETLESALKDLLGINLTYSIIFLLDGEKWNLQMEHICKTYCTQYARIGIWGFVVLRAKTVSDAVV